MEKKLNRRTFVKASALGIIGASKLGFNNLNSPEREPKNKFSKIKEYRTLGRTGFRVSDIGIGTSRVYPGPIITALLEAGVNYIDTGERYGRGAAETSIRQAIKGADRKSLFVTTKVRLGPEDSKTTIISRFHKCQERLQTDYVDCLMIHGAPSVEALKQESFHQASSS